MYHPILRDNFLEELQANHRADIVIGLPSYKNLGNALAVAEVVKTAVPQYYPERQVVVLNADAGQNNIIRHALVEQACPSNMTILSGRYHGPLGNGAATAAILDAALALDARAIIILDSNNTAITPEWIPGLGHLILEADYDLIKPRYHCPLPNGGLSDILHYPLFRTLWGTSIRHPAASDFALSPELATAILDADIWETDAATDGLPLWLSSFAALNQWTIAETALGDKQDDDTDITSAIELANGLLAVQHARHSLFHGQVSTLFTLAYQHRKHWAQQPKITALPVLKEFKTRQHATPIPHIDPTPLLDYLAASWLDYRMVWKKILTLNNLSQLEGIAARQPDQFYFPAPLWTRIVYDFLVVFNKGELDPRKVLDALYPIYLGRLGGYLQEVAGLLPTAQSGTVGSQAREFEELRNYLRTRWRTYQPWEENVPNI